MPEKITSVSAMELRVDCPRHTSTSKTSFVVSLTSGLWHCFGCRVGGDVIQLAEFVGSGVVTKCAREGISPTHRAARDALAERAGLPPLSSFGHGQDERTYAEARAVFEAMTEIIKIFHERLVNSDGAEVLGWFQAKYGITRETVDTLKIGWSGGPTCFDEVVARGHVPEHVKATGFFRFGLHQADVYSYFKERIVFPYWRGGQVVYAIGRKTPWTAKTEYENGKYKKLALHDGGKHSYISPAIANPALFGEDILRTRPEAVILTEGIADAIASQQAGFPTVSPVTVRLKRDEAEEVAKLLRGVGKVYLIQDNELSGVGLDGALDTADALEQHGVACKVVELPLSEECTQARAKLQRVIGDDGMLRFLAAPASQKRRCLEEILSGRPSDLEEANASIERSKIDLCDFLREAPAPPEALKALLGRAVKPIDILIERLLPVEDREEQLRSIAPILARIMREEPPIQSDCFKKLKSKLALGWSVSDLKKVAKKVATKDRGRRPNQDDGSGEIIECNDFFLGDAFARESGADVRFCDELGAWAIWDGKKWRWDLNLTIEDRARTTVERIGRIAEARALAAAQAGDEADAKRFGSFSLRALSVAGIQAALKVARGTCRTEDEQERICLPVAGFDPYVETKHLLNCINGVLDLRTRQLVPHEESKSLTITKLASVEYEPTAKCPAFLKALDAIFEADIDAERAGRLIDLLQCAIGYSLLGDQTHHLLFLMYGPGGRNGKSVLLRIFQEILGDYATAAPPRLLTQKRGESHPTELADLFGRRFVAAVETGRGERLDEALVKHLTGGDKIKARRMREDFWEFQPTHHLWVATNNLPRADAFDRALWARLRVIPFRRRFLKPGDDGFDKSRPECLADDTLADRILEKEREGVFAWMVEGCKRYLKSGAVPNPPESQEAVAEYRQENDPIGEWIEEWCMVEGAGQEDRRELPSEWATPSDVLHEHYSGWCQARRRSPVSSNSFGRALTEKGFPSTRIGSSRVRGRLGILIREVEPTPAPDLPDGGGR